MSTEFIFDPPVSEQRFLAAAKKFGYKPDKTEENAKDDYYPIGKHNDWAWVSITGENRTVQATVFGANSCRLLYTIAHELGVECLSEHDERFHEIIEADEQGEHGKFFTIDLATLVEMSTPVDKLTLDDGTEVIVHELLPKKLDS